MGGGGGEVVDEELGIVGEGDRARRGEDLKNKADVFKTCTDSHKKKFGTLLNLKFA